MEAWIEDAECSLHPTRLPDLVPMCGRGRAQARASSARRRRIEPSKSIDDHEIVIGSRQMPQVPRSARGGFHVSSPEHVLHAGDAMGTGAIADDGPFVVRNDPVSFTFDILFFKDAESNWRRIAAGGEVFDNVDSSASRGVALHGERLSLLRPSLDAVSRAALLGTGQENSFFYWQSFSKEVGGVGGGNVMTYSGRPFLWASGRRRFLSPAPCSSSAADWV